jgi:hypothetical protein
MKMKVENLTPHTLNIKNVDGAIVNIAPSGAIARVGTTRVASDIIAGLRIYNVDFGEIEGLPEPQTNTIYVVSALVQARTNRMDVFAPGEVLRDGRGRVVGCIGLTANAPSDERLS